MTYTNNHITTGMSQKKKTIFITSFHGLVSRILEGGILDHLLTHSELQLVIFVPVFKKAYFKKLFENKKQIIVEGVSVDLLPRRTHFFQKLSFLLLDTKTMRIIRFSFRGPRYLYQRIVAQGIAGGLGRWRVMRSLFRAINYYCSGKPVLGAYFEKYNPDLIFSTDSKHALDTQFIIEAKKRGIKTVSMVRSWDYLTAKGVLRVKPDTMLVHNEIIKQEAQQYADMREQDIIVVGMPHFDLYTTSKRTKRNIFFKKLGIPTEHRIVLVAPIGSKFGDSDAEILDILCEALEQKKLPSDLHFLVRFPPGDDADISRVRKSSALHVEHPGISFGGHGRKENEMSFADSRHLADSLFHSELMLTSPSTMVIDAAAFDKPIIFLGFEGRRQKRYLDSYVHIYDFDHMQNVVRARGARMAHTPLELIEYINHYLTHSSDERAGRKRIVREQCGTLDGNASKRIADILFANA